LKTHFFYSFTFCIHSSSLQAGIEQFLNLGLTPAAILLLISHLTGVLWVTARPKRSAIHTNPTLSTAPATPCFFFLSFGSSSIVFCTRLFEAAAGVLSAERDDWSTLVILGVEKALAAVFAASLSVAASACSAPCNHRTRRKCERSCPSAERRQLARLPQGVHRVRVQQQAVKTTLRGDCELLVRKLRQQNISPPSHRQQRRCDVQRFTARPVVSDELGFEHLQHLHVLGAAMPAIRAEPHTRTPAREVTNRLSRRRN
jgi:hypothetical protein